MKTDTHLILNRVMIRHLGQQPYINTWRAMQEFTNTRETDTPDELWCVEHPPIFTQGQAGKPEHILNPGEIPIVETDRGGQVTYHGPGQAVIYLLVDIRRKSLGIRPFVCKIERAVIDLLADYKILGETNPQAPGVYVKGAKICSLGLRIRRGSSFHGLSLNVDMDLSPFQRINPCGMSNIKVIQMRDFVDAISLQKVHTGLIQHLCSHLGYS